MPLYKPVPPPETPIFCASSPEAQALSDSEFWERVQDSYQPPGDYDDLPWDEMGLCLVGTCLRCGAGLFAEDYQQLRFIVDHDRELCDDCASELEPETDDPWDEIKSIF